MLREPDAVRRSMGLTGQAATVDELLTGRENLRLIGSLYGLSSSYTKAAGADLLERFSLTEAADRTVKTYSGGMRRRLDLAVSLIATPPVLFLDEPTTGLDPRSRVELWEVLRGLVKDGTTLLLTTQYLEEADQLADRIVVIDRGQIIAEGTPLELKDRSGKASLVLTVSRAEDLQTAADMLRQRVSEVHVDEAARQLTAPAERAARHDPDRRVFEDSDDRARRPRPQATEPRRRVPPPHRPPCRGCPRDRAGAGVMTTDTTTRQSASGIARPEIKPTGLLRQSLAITRRNLIHIKRMPEMLMDVTIQPVMFVLLFAYVFGGSISVQGSPAGYREWLMGGIMGQTIAFASFIVAVGPHRRHRQGHRRPDAVAADQPLGRARRPQHLQPAALQHRHPRDVGDRPVRGLADPGQLRRGGAGLRAAAAVGLRDDLDRHPGRVGHALGRGRQRADVHDDVPDHVPGQHLRADRQHAARRCGSIAEWNPISSLVQAVRQLWGNDLAPADAQLPLHHPVITTLIWTIGLTPVVAPLSLRAFRRRTDV